MCKVQSFIKLLLILTSVLFIGCDQQENISSPVEPVAAPQFQGTIIALGDSLTAGLGVPETAAWPALLENTLHEEGHFWQVINAGISGETSSGALSRIKWIIAQKPDIVILETGANDALRGIPVDVIKENIQMAAQGLKKAQVSVVLAGMQIVQNLGAEYTDAFANIYPDVAEETGVILIPFFLQGVAGEAELNQADAIHPNEKGQQVIAKTVYPYILKAISEKN